MKLCRSALKLLSGERSGNTAVTAQLISTCPSTLVFATWIVQSLSFSSLTVPTSFDQFLSDLVGNPKDCVFSRSCSDDIESTISTSQNLILNEPPREKTNNVVSAQIRHKPGCTSTEDG